MRYTIVCPHCSGTCAVVVRSDACTYFHVCECCDRTVRPEAGDCCVICSYGHDICPPRWAGGGR